MARRMWIVVLLAAAATAAADQADPRAKLDAALCAVASRQASLQVTPPDRLVVLRAQVDAIELRSTPPRALEDLRNDASRALASGRLRIEAVGVEGPNRSGRARVSLALIAGGRSLGTARVSVVGRVWGPALRAGATLRRGRPIPPDAVRVEDVDLTRLGEPPLRSLEALAGRVALRTVARGRILTPSLVRPRPVVRRGELVEVVHRSGRLEFRLQVEALADGAPGEEVAVRNVASGARLAARVLPDGSLRLSGAAARGAGAPDRPVRTALVSQEVTP